MPETQKTNEVKNVTYNEWKKLDIRVGKVMQVEKHPNADKLYILKVDIGGKDLQIVTGLVDYYKQDQLKGKNIVVITNLQPATFRGVKSEGMLLAAVDNDSNKIIILVPEKVIKVGAKVE